ncbi:MAG: glycosyltransferase family 4 protein [Acidisphaera sp.]|nr:glycosyltransferase family 4 protein [Acidisphaera sp.]
MTRILMIAHGHPDLGVGGGEIAAYRQCQELRAQGHEVLFMGRIAEPSGHGGTVFSVRDAGLSVPDPSRQDVLFHSPDFDHFRFSQRAKWAVYKEFRSLLDRFAPEVVHFHHYVHLGLELIREVRKYSGAVPIVLTLHEYLAICNNHGQMIKTEAAKAPGRLCDRAGPADCHACYPDRSPQDFFLRERFIKSFFSLVDAFVCPSEFLLGRYAQWGIAREKLVLLENGQPAIPADTSGDTQAESLCRRFAFFGQVSELKGVPLFLDAIDALPDTLRERLAFDIHGTLHHQSEEFRRNFAARVAASGDGVRFHGGYRPADLSTLMRRIGWVVVPSIWWENSPLVIQEAFNHGRPVICSNIGGPAEKVADGVTGLHFIAGDAGDLAERIGQAADAGLWASLRRNIRPPLSIGEAAQRHLDLYQRLALRRAPAPSPVPTPAAAAAASAPARRLARRAK